MVEDATSVTVGEVRDRGVRAALERWPLAPGSTWLLSTDADSVVPAGWVRSLLDVAVSRSAVSVAGMFINSRIPKLTMTVGYDPRFSHGDYGIFVRCAPERAADAEQVLRSHAPVEVRSER